MNFQLCQRLVTVSLLVGFLLADSRPAHAEAAGKISLPPGFRAELVYSVPIDTQGSWISLAVDDKGRLIASDQYGGLYRITPSPLGEDAEKTKVESISLTIGMAHGLLFHEGNLYVVLNGQVGAFTSGLYRLSDTNDDDQYDKVEQLRVLEGSGEHGPHALVLGPDGKSLYLCCGNFTAMPLFDRSLPAKVWQEDQLLPRLVDPNGHAVEIKAPGGWIARMDLDGENMELFSVGFRNMFDIAFNQTGELFTFDSDMEWDIGTPWYRPTRLCHVIPGSEFGWRTGNGVWPDYYPDSLPGAIDVGPTSPTGLAFGTGTKFPEKYQRALFAGDWSYGNIYVFHLEPNRSTYAGKFERFASAMPLGVTDMIVRPQDGALYFAVGGRRSESALYRIVWDPTLAPAATPAPNQTAATSPDANDELPHAYDLTARLKYARMLTEQKPGDLDEIWKGLASADRFEQFAARTALEHRPVDEWRARALAETNIDATLTALIALARVGEEGDQAPYVQAITQFDFAGLERTKKLALLRAAALGVMRLGTPTAESRAALTKYFDPAFPTGDRQLDRELSHLLIVLDAPKVVDRMFAILDGAVTQEEAIDVAVALSAAKGGWSIDQRKHLLEWFDKASRTAGGNSYFGYLVAARDRFIANFTDADRQALAASIEQPLVKAEAVLEAASRPFVREWKLDEATKAAEAPLTAEHFDNGRRLFSVAGCYNCHRFASEGSSVGPDLTGVGGRFGLPDLMRSIVEPNYEISDQYRQTMYQVNGQIVTGRVTNIDGEEIVISTNMLDPAQNVRIRRRDIESETPSKQSVMPGGLLNTLSAEEVADLAAFLRSGGYRDAKVYGKPEGPVK